MGCLTRQPICPSHSFSDYETPTNIHLKHSVQNIHSNSHSFETHAWHCVERGTTQLGGGESLLDTYREAYREAHYDPRATKGALREARQCSKGPLGEDGSHERPVGGMVRSHSQWWAHICRRMYSRRTAHTAPYSFRSNLLIDPQAVPSRFILNLRCLLLKTWRCAPTETRHAGTSCPALNICERDSLTKGRGAPLCLAISPGSWC